MYLHVAVWRCDPVIHYSGAYGVELIKLSEARGLCMAPATPCLPPRSWGAL